MVNRFKITNDSELLQCFLGLCSLCQGFWFVLLFFFTFEACSTNFSPSFYVPPIHYLKCTGNSWLGKQSLEVVRGSSELPHTHGRRGKGAFKARVQVYVLNLSSTLTTRLTVLPGYKQTYKHLLVSTHQRPAWTFVCTHRWEKCFT